MAPAFFKPTKPLFGLGPTGGTYSHSVNGVSSEIQANTVIMGRKEGNVLFNDALNHFYLRLYGVGHMVKQL